MKYIFPFFILSKVTYLIPSTSSLSLTLSLLVFLSPSQIPLRFLSKYSLAGGWRRSLDGDSDGDGDGVSTEIATATAGGTPMRERAVYVAIFETDAEIMKFYVRKWCKISSDVGIRSIIDRSYYKQWLSSSIQKIVTIPAAMQKVANHVPRVVHPDWLHKKVREKDDKFRQQKLADVFNSFKKDELLKRKDETVGISNVIEEEVVGDLEDFQRNKSSVKGPRPVV
ncbi:DNA polymerase epsilon catalytic subunit A-like [Humulus lupulus]|uniref:DNA polymerase epsilon catalytic subunit A-like n=1 Tax=Humulus lupulus TaxID=3486 RepID=UPI002B4111BF|nr:DNA polymerase epsilon catalytic subunit A-like [Humulus lupulus]XP_062117413.1 DNA polymerase epsilon catalytic subunit A-like [Humulus lupulus]XP_062117414.1 DNA polymerase epsilon catalytic subunit A-like [Humulus lupulus]XP_062117415.1 DNA polymerase epsilon catalytic subunit A-like [Humulus lupulus]